MDQAQIIRNGWLVQLATTRNLIATVRIYPFHELKVGPLPLLYDVQEMWPAVDERVQVNLLQEFRKRNEIERDQLKAYISSPPISGACYIFTEESELRKFLRATLQLFGETPTIARRRTADWIARSKHINIPSKDPL